MRKKKKKGVVASRGGVVGRVEQTRTAQRATFVRITSAFRKFPISKDEKRTRERSLPHHPYDLFGAVPFFHSRGDASSLSVDRSTEDAAIKIIARSRTNSLRIARLDSTLTPCARNARAGYARFNRAGDYTLRDA
ncbi:hypothetical protein P5V15_013252 [Pogonomyrmex californicus]